MDALTLALYIGAAVLVLLIARGLWILYMSSEARLEQTKAEVKAREGRNPDDAMTYHQDIEARALAYIKRIPLIGRAFRYF